MKTDTLLGQLHRLLTDQERVAAHAVFEIAPSALDADKSSLEVSHGFLHCRFFSVSDRHCPFELDFGRGEHAQRFNFFIGRGADFANYEPLATHNDALETQSDVRNFLRSTVEVESRHKNGEVVDERYVASGLTLDGRPLSFWCGAAPLSIFSKHAVQHRLYTPWMDGRRTEAPSPERAGDVGRKAFRWQKG